MTTRDPGSGPDDELPSSLTDDAYALLEVVHDFGSAGAGTDTAAADLTAGPPWFGLQQPAEELEAAGLIRIDREMANAAPEPEAAPTPETYFLAVTDDGRSLVHRRRPADPSPTTRNEPAP